MSRTVKVTIVVLLVLFWTVISAINFLAPLAPPAPELSSDIFYEITYEDRLLYLDLNELEQFVEYLQDAKPTRELSVNDTPTQKTYYKIDVYNNTDSLWRFFIYEYGGKAYYEIPYTGIYKVNSNILNLLSS